MRLVKVVAIVAATSFAVACGKGPAEAAVTAANAAVQSAQAEGSKFAPEQFAKLSAAAADAKAKLDAGDYKAALEAAQSVSSEATNVMQVAMAKKTEVMAAWTSMSGSLPEMAGAITKKVMELSASKKLPAGMDKAGLAAATTASEGITSAWKEASEAFAKGDIMAAVAKAGQVKTMVEEQMTKLGIAMPKGDAAPAAPSAEKK